MLKQSVLAAAFGLCLTALIGCGGGGGQLQDLGAISVQVPRRWTIQEPASKMRQAQYLLPKQGEDGEDATLVVFYFGPQGAGAVDANLERWFGQVKQPDGSPSKEAARVEKKTVAGMAVTLADVSGTYTPTAMGPMAPAGEPKPGYRMLAAIVESPKGAYYFKLTGPEQTVAHWKGTFDRFIGRIRKK